MLISRCIFAGILLLPALSAHALDIKGIRIGDTKNAVETRLGLAQGGLECKPLAADMRPADGVGDIQCNTPVPVIEEKSSNDEKLLDRVEIYRRNSRYLGEAVRVLYRFHHDALAQIVVQGIAPDSYDDIEKQLEAEFGSPVSLENSDRPGAQPNTTARWTDGKQELTFRRYGPDPAQTWLDIVDTDYRAAVAANKQ